MRAYFMSYFQDATVTHEGSTFSLSAEKGRALESGAYSWHGPGDPSSWLAVDVFNAARRTAASAPEAVALELAAKALGITVESLHTIIRWHEEYMRWHDGDSDYRVLSE
jgi:hypothetical protein